MINRQVDGNSAMTIGWMLTMNRFDLLFESQVFCGLFELFGRCSMQSAFIIAWHLRMVATLNAAGVLNMLDVVKAAPQARPKTT
mgnify:CR=1 FL=1